MSGEAHAPRSAEYGVRVVGFHTLPVAALLTYRERIVAVNPAYEHLMSVPAGEVIGRSIEDLTRQFVTPPDVPLVDRAAAARDEGQSDGTIWCRVVDGIGRSRSLRVVWDRIPGDPDMGVVYLLDEEGEANAKGHAEALARAGGELVRCRDEAEVLEQAVDALHARGFTVTVLLMRGDDPLLEIGPSRTTVPPERHTRQTAGVPITSVRPSREILTRFNPRFHERRAAFFQDFDALVDAAYEQPLADAAKRARPGRRVVQAPLFVGDVAYGALVVTSDLLTPALAGTIEMFAELVARAIENVRLQSELVRNERLAALGEAAAVLAHEVRNPVGSILNAVALVRGGHDPDELLSIIAEEAYTLERLVTDLLALGRPLAPKVTSTPLLPLCRRAVAMVRSRAAAPQVEIVVADAGEGAREARIDGDLVQLALLNVVRNAVEASRPGARVEVHVEPGDGDRVGVRVDDAGPGIPSDLADRVFEPFFTTRAAGTGIGLAVVRRIVDACGGSIEISTRPEGGGRVILWFPAA